MNRSVAGPSRFSLSGDDESSNSSVFLDRRPSRVGGAAGGPSTASSATGAAARTAPSTNNDNWLFQRAAGNDGFALPSSPNLHETPTSRPTAAAMAPTTLLAPRPPAAPTKRSEAMGVAGSVATTTAATAAGALPPPVADFSTPAPRQHANPSLLYEHLTRGIMPPPKRPARVSNGSSGWGSPRVSLARASLSTTASSQEEVESMAAPAAPRAPPRAEPRGGLFGSPRTPSGGGGPSRLLKQQQQLADANESHGIVMTPLRRGRQEPIMEEEEELANGSGLLGLSPAVHGLSRLRIGAGAKTPLRRDERSADGSVLVHSSGDDEGEDVWQGDAMRAKLLEDDVAPTEDRRALLDLMRLWREDAMKHHLYETAIFWGDKVLSLETSAQAWTDAYHLATAFFLTHRYAQAEHLLCSPLRNAAEEDEEEDDAIVEEPEEEQGVNGQNEGEADEEEVASSSRPLESDADSSSEGLAAALEATRNGSRLPATLYSKMEGVNVGELTDDEVGRKRKERGFTVSGTGTGSEATSGTGSGSGSTDSAMGEPSIKFAAGQGGEATEDAVARAWKREQKAALQEVKQRTTPSPEGVKLIDISSPARYLAAQCMVRQAKYHDALDLLNSERLEEEKYGPKIPCKDGGIKLASSKWHLRGLIQLRLGKQAEAQQSFVRALSLDVKNYEAFDQLVGGQLLSAREQWEFVQGLEYVAQAGDDGLHQEALQLVKLMYTTRLDKSGRVHAQQAAAARRQLYRLYRLDNNADVLLGLAEELFARQRYKDCHAVTQRIMDLSKDHEAALTVHVSTMVYLDDLRPTLFLLAHHLTDRDPDLAAAWYAVGCWYMASGRYSEARRYFSKAVSLNPRYAASWVAFGHCFANEGESDRAIVAYTTAERMFTQSHLPKLFIGIEHLHQGNLVLAETSLKGSALVWEEDALGRNERGVVAYYKGEYQEAINLFEAALEAADDVQMPASSWAPTHLNLGFAYRRSGRYEKARRAFMKTMELDPECGPAHTGLAMIYHREGYLDEAVAWYEKAQLLSPRDKQVKELLAYVLDELAQAAPIPPVHGAEDELVGHDDEDLLAGGHVATAGPLGSSLLMSSSSVSSSSLERRKAGHRGLGRSEHDEEEEEDEEMDQGEVEAEAILDPQSRLVEADPSHSHSQSSSAMDLSASMSMDESSG